jgi:hypothetical protein
VHSHLKAAQSNWTASHQTYLVLHLLPDCVSFLCAVLSSYISLTFLSSVCCLILDVFNHLPGAGVLQKLLKRFTDPEVNYSAHRNSPLDSVLGWMNPVSTLLFYSSKHNNLK